jgi:hypothetical protein
VIGSALGHAFRLVPVLTASGDIVFIGDDHTARELLRGGKAFPNFNARGRIMSLTVRRTARAAYYPPPNTSWTGSPPLLQQHARWPSVFRQPMRPVAEVACWATPGPAPILLMFPNRKRSPKPVRVAVGVLRLAA